MIYAMCFIFCLKLIGMRWIIREHLPTKKDRRGMDFVTVTSCGMFIIAAIILSN